MRPEYKCPICGDPRPFRLWIEKEPPYTCAIDPGMPENRRTITDVTQCLMQMQAAKTAADLRKACPEAFDKSGNMLPGQAHKAWLALANARAPKRQPPRR